ARAGHSKPEHQGGLTALAHLIVDLDPEHGADVSGKRATKSLDGGEGIFSLGITAGLEAGHEDDDVRGQAKALPGWQDLRDAEGAEGGNGEDTVQERREGRLDDAC